MEIASELLRSRMGAMTRYQFARHLGVSWRTVDRILKGERGIGMRTAKKIAAIYPDLKDELLKEVAA